MCKNVTLCHGFHACCVGSMGKSFRGRKASYYENGPLKAESLQARGAGSLFDPQTLKQTIYLSHLYLGPEEVYVIHLSCFILTATTL